MSGFRPLDVEELATGAPATQAQSASEVQLPPLKPDLSASSDPSQLGFQQGFQAGMAQAEQQTRSLLQALEQAAQAWQSEKQVALRELENQAALLAYSMACDLSDAQIGANPEQISQIAQGALGEVSDASSVVLFIHPEDLAFLDQELLTVPGQHLTLRQDPNLQRGDCRVESPLGDIDATRSGRQEFLREKLFEIIEQRRS